MSGKWIVAGVLCVASLGGVASGAVMVERRTVVAGLDAAAAVAVTARGRLVVADAGRGVVERYTPNGTRIGTPVVVPGVRDVAAISGLSMPWRLLLPHGTRMRAVAAAPDGSDDALLTAEGGRMTGATAGGAGGGRIYTTDFARGRVSVLDRRFRPLTGVVFNDETIPAEYSPYKIEKFGDRLYVAYARRGPRATVRPGKGAGFVDVFDGDGVLRRRLVTNKKLNAPTGMAIAPAWMGEFAGDLLVANAGDGTISAYDRLTGDFEGQVRNANGAVMRIDGLSDVYARDGALYVTSDRGVERLAGLAASAPEPAFAGGAFDIGGATAAVPEPGIAAAAAALASVAGGLRRRRRRR